MPRLSRTAITSRVWTAEEPKLWITARFTDSHSPPKNSLVSRCCSTRWNSSAFARSAKTITPSQPGSTGSAPTAEVGGKGPFLSKTTLRFLNHFIHAMIEIASLVGDRSNLDRKVNHGKSCQHWVEVGINQVAGFRHGVR